MKTSTIFRTSALILFTVSQAVHLQAEEMSNEEQTGYILKNLGLFDNRVMNKLEELETTMNEMNSNINTIYDDIT